MIAIEPAATEDQGTPWLLALIPLDAWRVIDILRLCSGRPSRSAFAEAAVLRALALEVRSR